MVGSRLDEAALDEDERKRPTSGAVAASIRNRSRPWPWPQRCMRLLLECPVATKGTMGLTFRWCLTAPRPMFQATSANSAAPPLPPENFNDNLAKTMEDDDQERSWWSVYAT